MTQSLSVSDTLAAVRANPQMRKGARVRGLLVMNPESEADIFAPEDRRHLDELLDLRAPALDAVTARARRDLLGSIDVLVTSWGAPALDADILAASPRLRAVFHAAGTIRPLVTPEFWDRGILISSAWKANALPTAEFAFACIIFGLKRAFAQAAAFRQSNSFSTKLSMAGGFGSRVGLVGFGAIGKRVRAFLAAMDVEVWVFDPYLSASVARDAGVRKVSLEELFRSCDVVSLHAPWTPETSCMIRGAHLRLMKHGAAFVNTARGGLVHEPELCTVLAERSDLQAMLDTMWPEPAEPDSPLYTLPNVFLTPHIAGSHGAECRRMGRSALEELQRWLKGEPLENVLTAADLERMA